METAPANYHQEFLRSPHHAWLGILTLGLGFLSAHALGLIVGVTAYALGWIYLPDLPFFRRWVDRRRQAAQQSVARAQVEEFIKRREFLLLKLSPQRRERYRALAAVCQDIEAAGSDHPLAAGEAATDPRLRKLDELMWTFLRLLSLEEALEEFLQTEQREDVPARIREAEAEVKALSTEIEARQKEGNGAAVEARQRLRDSRLELLEVLRKRLQRAEQAQDNLALVVSNQERLDQQIKLIRADSLAINNTDALTSRIDATVENLDQTNKWLAELDQFKDSVGDLPPSDLRVGFKTEEPPPILPRRAQKVVRR